MIAKSTSLIVSISLGGWLILPVNLCAQAVPKAELFIGYSFLTAPDAVLVGSITNEKHDSVVSGWTTEVALGPKYIAAVGRAMGIYTSGTQLSRGWIGIDHTYGILGGVRGRVRTNRNVELSTQVLLGFVHSDVHITSESVAYSGLYSALTFGGGIQFPLMTHLNVRFEGDVLRTNRRHLAQNSSSSGMLQLGIAIPLH